MGDPKNIRTVEEVLRDKYDTMFGAEKKVIDYVLMHAEQAVSMNISELASASGTSNATVVRMCHHAGFSGFNQFRILLARDQGQQMNTTSADAIEQIFFEYAEDVRRTGRSADGQAMREAARLILSAGYVHIAAVGNTMPLALYTSFRLARLGIRNTAAVDPVYFFNSINLAQEGDIALLISHSGNSKQILQVGNMARDKGMKVIAITSGADSSLAKQADIVVSGGSDDYEIDYDTSHSHLQDTVLIDVLIELVMNFDKIDQTDPEKPESILKQYKVLQEDKGS